MESSEKWRDALTLLEQRVQAIQDSDSFRRYLDIQARFHKYSFGNCLLIASQRPNATRVAGYVTWKSLGRQVKRGSKGIMILVPYMIKVKAEDSTTVDNEAETTTVTRFGTGHVFDIADTEGTELPTLDVPTLSGDDNGLYACLVTCASTFSLSVDALDTLPGEMMGYIQGRLIVIRRSSPAQMSKTLAHEIAHHLDAAKSSNGDSESIAESVAYIVCQKFGIDSGIRTFPYIASWAQAKTLRNHLATIQRIASQIIETVEASAVSKAA